MTRKKDTAEIIKKRGKSSKFLNSLRFFKNCSSIHDNLAVIERCVSLKLEIFEFHLLNCQDTRTVLSVSFSTEWLKPY